jgi:ATP-binding cassette, subfamily B, bacterial
VLATREFGGSVTQLIRDRWTLLGLVLAAGRRQAAQLAAIMVGATLLPAATAAATGALIGRVVQVSQGSASLASITPSLTAVGLLLVADLTADSLMFPIREDAALRVNGVIRGRIRDHLSAPVGVDHLDDQRIRKLSSLAVYYRDPVFNLGAAAQGQLWLVARFVGAFGSAALLATYSIPLAAFCLATLLAQRAILRRQFAMDVARTMDEGMTAYRAANYWRELSSSPKAAKEIRLFGFHGWVVGKAMDHLAVMSRLEVNRLSKVLPQQWITFVLSALAVGVPFAFLARGAVEGDISTGQLAMLLGATVGLTWIGSMGWEAFGIELAIPQLQALRDLSIALPATSGATTKTVPSQTPRIAFEGVSFRYPGKSADVLHDLDLVIEPGESLAIVGENGAGKTTLLKLLGALYAPTAGRILIDGVDLRDIDSAEWRRRLAVVFQDFVHYELSARDNVALGAEATDDLEVELQAAAEAAGAADLIAALPLGWSSTLSPGYTGGAELSGGQWQRIALARALFAAKRDARVIVLDEPTANLDVHAETALFDQFLTHAQGSTTIVVSHRFSTVRRARRIVVIADGHVIEDGGHDSLLAAGGTYSRLYRLQADRFEWEPPSSDGEDTP